MCRGLHFCRYVDDFHIFCASKSAAKIALYDFAEVLDQQQRLTVQMQKTRIMSKAEFIQLADTMLVERPINEVERLLIGAVKSETRGDPYSQIKIGTANAQTVSLFSKDNIEEVLDKYLKAKVVDYAKLGWFLRQRVAQIGAPEGLPLVIDRLEHLHPVVASTAKYIINASANFKGDSVALGESVIKALRDPVVQRLPYLEMVLLDLFSSVPDLNHVDRHTANYVNATSTSLVKAAVAGNRAAWLSERKSEFRLTDSWLSSAIVMASKCLVGDEGRFWVEHAYSHMTPMEKMITRTLKPPSNTN